MLELIKSLRKIKYNIINCGSYQSHLIMDIIKYYNDKNISINFNNDNFIREYMRLNNIYNSEEEFEIFKRDLFTKYFFTDNIKFYISLKQKLIECLYNDNFTINQSNVKVLNTFGFRCYPVSYNEKGCILGVITPYGTIVLNPFKKGEKNNER